MQVHEEGEYMVSAEFSTSSATAPVTIIVNTQGSGIRHEIREDIDAPYLPSPDRIERGEVYERQWLQTGLDTLMLTTGSTWISFRLLNGNEASNFELKSLLINKL